MDPKRPIFKQEVGSLEEISIEVAIAVLWAVVGMVAEFRQCLVGDC